MILYHCVKSVHIRSYSGPYFPTFGLNKERYRVSIRIESYCGKIQIPTRITLNTDTFYAVYSRFIFAEYQKRYLSKLIEDTSSCCAKLGLLRTIYKSFICPHLEYSKTINDQAYNNLFLVKLGCNQYAAVALAISGSTKGSSSHKFCNELCFKMLCKRL